MSAASEMDNGSDMDEPMGSQSKVISTFPILKNYFAAFFS